MREPAQSFVSGFGHPLSQITQPESEDENLSGLGPPLNSPALLKAAGRSNDIAVVTVRVSGAFRAGWWRLTSV